MKTTTHRSTLCLLLFFFALPICSHASPIVNLATLDQSNTCIDCFGGEQINTALLLQSTNSDESLEFLPDLTPPSSSDDPGSNVAIIFQDGFCSNCTNVEQNNLVIVIQGTEPANIILLGETDSTVLEIPLTEFGNVADIAQTNLCINCVDVYQLNRAFIVQNMALDDVFPHIPDIAATALTSTGLDDLISLGGESLCVDCFDVQQNNGLTFVQDLALASPNTVPEPGTLPLVSPFVVGLLFLGGRSLSTRRARSPARNENGA